MAWNIIMIRVLQAVIPAANGVSTAHALATIYAMHANGGVWQGQTLITPAVLADMRAVRVDGFDAVMPANMRWRSGFHRLFSLQHTPNAYGHMGYNGSVAFCDPDRHLSFAFIHNFDTTMLNDVRQFVLSETAIARTTP
ncbi:Beta-lactamase [Moraxella lacunata]|uniref:Beta-lactamase n=1 Tax=Moraxella lacunata TaxID=477 RepID=A0A378QKY9_MORLA|nr:Beta-lactamase [Moraxella lacunata]